MSNQIDISGVDSNLIQQLQQQQMYNSLNSRVSMASRIIQQDDMSDDDDDDDEDVMKYSAMLGKKYNKRRGRIQSINIAQFMRKYMEYQQKIQNLQHQLMDKNEDCQQMTQIIQEQERKIEDYQHEIKLKDAKINELEEEAETDQDYMQELEMEINQILYKQNNNNKNDIIITESNDVDMDHEYSNNVEISSLNTITTIQTIQIPMIDADGDNNYNDNNNDVNKLEIEYKNQEYVQPIYNDIDDEYNNEATISTSNSIGTNEPIQLQTTAMDAASPQPPNDLSGDLKQVSIANNNTYHPFPDDPDDWNFNFSDDRDTNIYQYTSSDHTDNDDEIEQELPVNIHPVFDHHAHNLYNNDNNNHTINNEDTFDQKKEDEQQNMEQQNNIIMPNPFNNGTINIASSSSLIPSLLTSNNSLSRSPPHEYNKYDTMFSDAGHRHYHLDVLPQIIKRMEHNIQSQQLQCIDPYIFATFIVSIWKTYNAMMIYLLLFNLYQKKL